MKYSKDAKNLIFMEKKWLRDRENVILMNSDQNLKLFPLNKVLFPGMPLYLNIFEERYKQLINECIEENAPFGVLLIKKGHEINDETAQTFNVGCAAKISHYERLADNRMHLIAFGTRKFSVSEFFITHHILSGKITFDPEIEAETRAITEFDNKLRDLLLRYMKILAELQETDFHPIDFPEDTIQLTYFIANILSIPLTSKQKLLCENSSYKLMQKVTRLFGDEFRILKMKYDLSKKKDMGPFYHN